MITIATGNLLKANVDALVNTVNTEGVMGKGIALQFKRAYPKMYDHYRAACDLGQMQLGKMQVVELGELGGGPRFVINFPTKKHWKSKSKIEDIKNGLVDLVDVIRRYELKSIAVPPLGCGYGGLAWSDVRPLIERALGHLENVRVELFSPDGAPPAEDMPNRTIKKPLTPGGAAVVALVDKYRSALLDPMVRLVEVHKLMYFLEQAGEPLRLKYTKGTYGPYSNNLRFVLNKLEGHYLQGFGDGDETPLKQIELIPGSAEEASSFLSGRLATEERMERVAALIEGYEDPFGLELLGSVHWVMMQSPLAAESAEVAVKEVWSWNNRKARLMKTEHIERAWERLKHFKWDTEAASVVH
ncbi:macro domain-containing protein [Xanthomonas sp. BRIP62411]|uniref:type II toxin-antitoxin system antitoxin DNA ADP-ribosyl glycohydrolase DarG n=1 Tax=Xanthomonas sp. BRIP62411 TaxID=2182389 RepID=UPI000F8E2205|nr:macro domain-containing protein [Xanthomonas sp. BRIP62411]